MVTGSGVFATMTAPGTRTAWPAPFPNSTSMGLNDVHAFIAAATTPLPSTARVPSFDLAASVASFNNQALLRSFVEQQHQQTLWLQPPASLVHQECATRRMPDISPTMHTPASTFSIHSSAPVNRCSALTNLAANDQALHHTLSKLQGSVAKELLRQQPLQGALTAGSALLSQCSTQMMTTAAAISSSSSSSHDEPSSNTKTSSPVTKTSSLVAGTDVEEVESLITTFPRRKAGQERFTSEPILLNKSCIETLFHLSLQARVPYSYVRHLRPKEPPPVLKLTAVRAPYDTSSACDNAKSLRL